MKITFLGAAHEVTGSCIEQKRTEKIFLLSGTGMEKGADIFENHKPFVNPNVILNVYCLLMHILTIRGNLPLLYKNGFHG